LCFNCDKSGIDGFFIIGGLIFGGTFGLSATGGGFAVDIFEKDDGNVTGGTATAEDDIDVTLVDRFYGQSGQDVLLETSFMSQKPMLSTFHVKSQQARTKCVPETRTSEQIMSSSVTSISSSAGFDLAKVSAVLVGLSGSLPSPDGEEFDPSGKSSTKSGVCLADAFETNVIYVPRKITTGTNKMCPGN
jgi:hypothetical protein